MAGELGISKEAKLELAAALPKLAPTLLGGGLGKADMKPIELEIEGNAKPRCSRCYSVPEMHGH